MVTLNPVQIETLGLCDWQQTAARMQSYTASRAADAPDLLLICEHESVYTLGQSGKIEHVLSPGSVAVLPSTRGGQVTYHGRGQVVAYPLLDLRRRGYFVKEYVHRIEESVIRTLMHFGLTGHRVPGAPGIYVRLDDPRGHARLVLPPNPDDHGFVGLGKVAALGIKVSRHCTYHGVALNVAMDLEPFLRINPCGYPGLQTVSMASLGVDVTWSDVAPVLAQQLVARL